MKPGYLSQYFVGVACKRLSAVEADRQRSNQHEFDGVTALRELLGPVRKAFVTHFLYLSDEQAETTSETGQVTWYDARERHPTRSEWRLYFPTTQASEKTSTGDLLVIGRRSDDSLLILTAAQGSTAERQVLWLFGLTDPVEGKYVLQRESEIDRIKLVFSSRLILEHLGIDIDDHDDAHLEKMLARFNGTFPPTSEFSSFARSITSVTAAGESADALLMDWLDQEEKLFRSLEKHLVSKRLEIGFANDVSGFIKFSLSVQNRRKARAGAALENHLAHLFTAAGLRFRKNARTETNARPDFLFPGDIEYHDPQFPESLLTMLGAKSTCKDRWRQVLSEADRIARKHLLTLEPGISKTQTDEMHFRNLQLVVPAAIHPTYTVEQQKWLMTVDDFMREITEKQHRMSNHTSDLFH